MAQIPIKRYGNNGKTTKANYKLLYYLGEEFATITDETKRYGMATGGWGNLSNVKAGRYNKVAGETLNAINTDGYSKVFAYYAMSTNAGSHDTVYDGTLIGTDINTTGADAILDNVILYEQPPTGGIRHFIIGNIPTTNKKLAIGNKIFGGEVSTTSYQTLSKQPTYISFYSTFAYPTDWQQYSWYCIGLCNEDNISKLSSYGSDITTILSNSAQLFQDKNAITFIANHCTGDFMIQALNNSTFLTQLNDSTNENTEIIKSDVDWARFIDLL